MRLTASTGLGFLMAVLWFDLMFDVQVRSHRSDNDLPEDVVASIAGYYRRVTTDARPMNRLVALAMLITMGSLVGEIVVDDDHRIAAALALGLVVLAVGRAGTRTVGNAVRLGQREDPLATQSLLARQIYRDHCACLALVLGAFVAHIAISA